MEEFALFDADGKRIDGKLSLADISKGFKDMAFGTVAIESAFCTVLKEGEKEKTIEAYFDLGAGARSGVWGGINLKSTRLPFCKFDDPKSWFKMVMRLYENSKVPASYDIAAFYTSKNSQVARLATAIAIEGSVDGVTWEPVAENDALEVPDEGPRWYADTRAELSVKAPDWYDYTLKDHVGFPMRGFSTKGVAALTMPVTVFPGATLKSESNASICSLVLSKTGNGTIEGFAIPEEGSLAVEGEGMGSGIQSIPVDFRNCTGLKNIEKWNLTINGGSARARNIRVSDDGAIELVPPGLVIVFK